MGLQDDSKKDEKPKLKLQKATQEYGVVNHDNIKEKIPNTFLDQLQSTSENPNNSKPSSNKGMSTKLSDNDNCNSIAVDEYEDTENHPNTLGTQYCNKKSTHANESQFSLETFTKNTVGIEMVVGRYMEV